MLSAGDQVSSKIKVFDLEEKETTLAEVKTKFKVVYFYPKDNTPGCTQQACAFRDVVSAVLLVRKKDRIERDDYLRLQGIKEYRP